MDIPEQYQALKTVMSQQAGTDGAAILNQQTPASPGAIPGTIPPSVQPQGSMQPPQAMPSASAPTPSGTGMPVGDPESQIIIKALNSRLSTLSKIDQAKAGVQ